MAALGIALGDFDGCSLKDDLPRLRKDLRTATRLMVTVARVFGVFKPYRSNSRSLGLSDHNLTTANVPSSERI